MKFEEFRNGTLNEAAENSDRLFKQHLANAHPKKIDPYNDNTHTYLEMAHRIAHTPEKVAKVHEAAKVRYEHGSKKVDEGHHKDGSSAIVHHGLVYKALRHARIGVLDHDTAKKLIDHHMEAAHKIMQTPEHKIEYAGYVNGQVEQHNQLRARVDKFHKGGNV